MLHVLRDTYNRGEVAAHRIANHVTRFSRCESIPDRGLVGGVRNCEDGRVELEVEGPKDRILTLIDALKVGPPASRVTDIRVEWVPATGRQTNFAVWY